MPCLGYYDKVIRLSGLKRNLFLFISGVRESSIRIPAQSVLEKSFPPGTLTAFFLMYFQYDIEQKVDSLASS